MIDGSHRILGCLGLIAVLLGSNFVTSRIVLAKESKPNPTLTAETILSNLADGAYQFCTEPEPNDWRDGAGACLNFLKQGTTIDGYYGYPHSGSYVCVQGHVIGDWLKGMGLVTIWLGGYPEPDMLQTELNWGQKDRLYLNQGQLVHREGLDDEQVRWIIFHKARLNMQGLYPYPQPRMTSPTQLCDWHSN